VRNKQAGDDGARQQRTVEEAGPVVWSLSRVGVWCHAPDPTPQGVPFLDDDERDRLLAERDYDLADVIGPTDAKYAHVLVYRHREGERWLFDVRLLDEAHYVAVEGVPSYLALTSQLMQLVANGLQVEAAEERRAEKRRGRR
jgi:hypothetical protein